MQLGRRIVTIMVSLALLQLMLLGSAAPCAPTMADAGGHAAHSPPSGEAHDGPAVAQHAHDGGERGSLPAPECEIRSCAASPVIVYATVALAGLAPLSASVEAVADGRPHSLVSSLDPPPPRA
jgi:hypothetical protein